MDEEMLSQVRERFVFKILPKIFTRSRQVQLIYLILNITL